MVGSASFKRVCDACVEKQGSDEADRDAKTTAMSSKGVGHLSQLIKDAEAPSSGDARHLSRLSRLSQLPGVHQSLTLPGIHHNVSDLPGLHPHTTRGREQQEEEEAPDAEWTRRGAMVVLLRCVAETRFSVMFGLSFLQQLAAAAETKDRLVCTRAHSPCHVFDASAACEERAACLLRRASVRVLGLHPDEVLSYASAIGLLTSVHVAVAEANLKTFLFAACRRKKPGPCAHTDQPTSGLVLCSQKSTTRLCSKGTTHKEMGDAHEHRGTVRTPPRSQGVHHTAHSQTYLGTARLLWIFGEARARVCVCVCVCARSLARAACAIARAARAALPAALLGLRCGKGSAAVPRTPRRSPRRARACWTRGVGAEVLLEEKGEVLDLGGRVDSAAGADDDEAVGLRRRLAPQSRPRIVFFAFDGAWPLHVP